VGAAAQGRRSLRGVLHVRQTVKRDVASRDADRATVDMYGREVGPPKNGKARTISLPRWLRDMLAEHLTQPAPGAGPEHKVFHTASGTAAYHTVRAARVRSGRCQLRSKGCGSTTCGTRARRC
jgi:hypothetical protein